ncbi:MAG: hypothetical protein KF817_12050 [Phycisphaeraceae bacterium]|nr:hypothetical protein [Phycisphaeraceae bacterium]
MSRDAPLPDNVEHLSVRDLRRRWKPIKEKLRAEAAEESLRIRLHRCFSWMARLESLGDEAPADDRLLFRWIALNSLYATWDEDLRRPRGDREDLRAFLSRIEIHDHDGRIPTVLGRHWGLVVRTIEDPALTRLFWEASPDEGIREALGQGQRAALWGEQGRVGRILGEVVDRIYFLRCQLAHGAATAGGARNRRSVDRAAALLGHLLREFVVVLIDHGPGRNWGTLPYPPTPPGLDDT